MPDTNAGQEAFSMKFNRSIVVRAVVLVTLAAALTGLSSRLQADTGTCGGATITLPFTDVAASNIFFCSIAGAFFSGLTNGTTPTTYNPNDPVPREQMAAFVSRTLDQSVKRSNPRAALGEWWRNQAVIYRAAKIIGRNPRFLACDGLTVWVSCTESNSVLRVDIRTGNLICNLTGIPSPEQIVVAGDYVWIASAQIPGTLYTGFRESMGSFSPSPQPFVLGSNPIGMTYDGLNLWTANDGTGPGTGSVSRVNLNGTVVTTFTTGFSQPRGILFDGANLWVTDAGDTSLKRVDRNNGGVLQTISLSGSVQHPIFDGTNLWIPSTGPDKLYVVRGVGGLTGTVLATLTGNGLNSPFQAAFDGERICVTNAGAGTVSLWKATDLSQIGSVTLNTDPTVNAKGICSDGTTFFIGVRDEMQVQGLFYRF